MNHPIPASGMRITRPILEMPIELYWRHDMGINWYAGEPVTIAQLEDAIEKSAGQRLPNDLLVVRQASVGLSILRKKKISLPSTGDGARFSK